VTMCRGVVNTAIRYEILPVLRK